MEQLLIVVAACFLLLPLPLCIYLIVRSNKQERLLQDFQAQTAFLQRQVEKLQRGQATPQGDTAPEPEAKGKPEDSSQPAAPAPSAAVSQDQPPQAPTPPPIPKSPTPTTGPTPAAPLVASPRQAEPRRSPEPASQLRILPLLRSVGFWPPEDLARRESGLIQWWFPRIGGLLAVLTVIFFAVYVSRGSPPWLKWALLMLVDAAVIGTGAYFLRKPKRRRFGSTLLAVGLSMTYVSIVAGYAAPPVRVFESALMGIVAQLACVAAIFAVSLRLRESNIGILASIFGYTSTIFSAYVGWNEGALLSAFVLQLAGMATGYRLKSLPLVSVASIGVYLPVAAFCALKSIGSATYTLPHSLSALVFLCLAVSALPVASLTGRLAERFTARSWRLLHGANTTLCLVVGYAYFRFFTTDLVLFCGTLALLFAAWSALFLRQGLRSFLFQLFFIKAAGLAALWAANYFDGDLRWFALIIDAAVVAGIARLSSSRWKEAASFLLWLAAVILALDALLFSELAPWSTRWIMYLLLPLIGVASQSWLFGDDRGGSGRFALYMIAALANGALLTGLLLRTQLAVGVDPAYLATVPAVVALVGLAPGFSARVATMAAAPPLLAAHIDFWLDPIAAASFAVVLLVSLAGAYAAARKVSPAGGRRHLLPEWAILALSMISLIAFLENAFWDAAWLPFVYPALALLAFAARKRPFRTLADTAPIPLAFLVFNAQSEEYSLPIAACILVLSALVLAWPRIAPKSITHPHLLRPRAAWRPAFHLVVAALALSMALRLEAWFHANLLLTFSGFGFFALWKLHRHRSALVLSLGLLALGLSLTVYASAMAEAFSDERAPWAKDVLAMGLLQALGFLGCAVWLAKGVARRISIFHRTLALYGLALGSFAAIAFSLSYRDMGMDAYYTPLIAVYCLLLVSLGIALKIKPFRMVAIVGFLLPLGRLFVYDIKETLYRIIAFAALALLLTFIGYLYNRFASRIE